MAKLPMELTTLILCRLPAKSLVRLSSVSKTWASLFSDTYFEKLHCQQKQQDLKLIMRHDKLYSLDLGSLDCALRVDYLLQDSDFTVEEVLGFNNGMLCLSLSSMSSSKQDTEIPKGVFKNLVIVICNLSTGARRIVPPSPIDLYPMKFSLEPWEFHTSGDDYKLVRIWQNIFPQLHEEVHRLPSEIKVYSMKTNCWSSVDQDISLFSICGTLPVLLDGVFYWIAGPADSLTYEDRTSIVAFDLADGVYRQVPYVYQGNVRHFYCLGLMRVKLCVMCDDYLGVKFLTMEVCGDVISWLPLASFTSFDSLFPRHSLYFRAMTFSTNGDNHVLLDWRGDEFIFCNLAKGTAVKRQIQFISLQRVKKRKAGD